MSFYPAFHGGKGIAQRKGILRQYFKKLLSASIDQGNNFILIVTDGFRQYFRLDAVFGGQHRLQENGILNF